MQDRFKFRALVRGYLKLTAEQQYTEIKPLICLDDILVLNGNIISIQWLDLTKAIDQQLYYLDTREKRELIENLLKNHYHDEVCVQLTPEKILQSTGLRDKNDELIYEYDICRINGEGSYRLVNWDCKKLKFTIGDYSSEELETFGNIYSIVAKRETNKKRLFKGN